MHPSDLKKLDDILNIDVLIIFEGLFEGDVDRQNWEYLLYKPHNFDKFKFQKIIMEPINRKEKMKIVIYQK
ncbi:hypothetical protein MNBD_UNCLBAC01-897 [hydrothermal vent metagenome]|uniref:Uncharacterized protein n=1 Tax=hydrothermal vent metagenome TaxID=652676 RepID=A0A3B1E4C1_9ZZZZ